MSFSLTTPQMRDRSKTVTRRLNWKTLQPGTRIQAAVKCMGLKTGEKLERLGLLEVVSVRREPLNDIDAADVRREGFPDLTRREFIDLFCQTMKCDPTTIVTRIEFKHLGTDA